MENYNIYEADYCILSEEFKEDGIECDRISFVIRSDESKVFHDDIVDKEIKRLEEKNDEKYTSWRFTCKKNKKLQGSGPHITVIHFRVRDVY